MIGADDPLGEAVVREALVRGCSVRATAPLPDRVPRLSPALQVLRAQSEVQEELVPAVRGADAVVLALSPQLGAEASMLATESAIATVRALREAGVRRLVAVSSTEVAGPTAAPVALRRVLGPVHHRLHHGGLQDLRRLEHLLAGSGLDWTVLRSGRLTDLLGTGEHALVPAHEDGSRTIAREDLARALVDQALSPGQDPRVLAVRA